MESQRARNGMGWDGKETRKNWGTGMSQLETGFWMTVNSSKHEKWKTELLMDVIVEGTKARERTNEQDWKNVCYSV